MFPLSVFSLSLSGLPWWLSLQSLSREDPLEEEMAPHSSILAWEIPWTEEPGGLQSMGSVRVRHDSVTEHTHHTELRLTPLLKE